MERPKFYVGIDISKDKFDACIIHLPHGCGTERKIASKVFSNQEASFKELLEWAKTNVPEASLENLPYSMEATGVYHEHLALYLHRNNQFVQVILPNLTANFAKRKPIRSKTDKIDAYLIALYSSGEPLYCWRPISDEFIELRALMRQRLTYSRMIAELKCLIHARSNSAFRSNNDIERYEESIKQHENVIKAIENECKQIIEGARA
jgi:transposase